MTSSTLFCAGYFVGHPATDQQLDRAPAVADALHALRLQGRAAGPALLDLAAARRVAEAAGGSPTIHAIWLTPAGADALTAEDDGSPLAEIAARRITPLRADADVAGHDVLGVGGELILGWVTEDAGRALVSELGLATEPPPFLPDAEAAATLAATLEADDLGAPVLWLPCWRTVHRAAD